jgi:prophage regulatory protein
MEGRMADEVPKIAHSRITENDFTQLPREAFVRLPQILAVFPVSPSTWWRGVKAGRYPRPVKLSAFCTAWRVEDIRELLARVAAGEL